MERIRAKTKACKHKGLNDPRSCFLKSAYTCSWNEPAERCDMK